MSSLKIREMIKDDSLEDFEFFDAEGDLDVDFSKSPIHDAFEFTAAKKLSSGLGVVISAMCTIVEEQGMVVTIPVKAVAATAVGALTGGLLGGPPGLAVGLITGAVLAYRTSPKHSKSPKLEPNRSSIRQIFNQMTLHQKKELLRELLSCLKQSSVRSLILEILKNEGIRNMALDVLAGFLTRKMGVSLVKPK